VLALPHGASSWRVQYTSHAKRVSQQASHAAAHMRRMLDQLRPCSAAVHITMYQRRQAQALRPSMRTSLQAPGGRCRVPCSPAHEACRRSAAALAGRSVRGHLVPGRQVQQLQNEGAPCAAGRLDCGQRLRARSSTAPDGQACSLRDDPARRPHVRDRTERLSSATHTRPGPLCSARCTAWRTRARASCKAPAPPSPGVRRAAEPCAPKAGGQGLTGPLRHVP